MNSICSACGYVNIPGEMFCGKCGVQLAPVPSVPPPPPEHINTEDGQLPFTENQNQSNLPCISISDHSTSMMSGGSSTIVGRLILDEPPGEIQLPQGKTELVIGRSDPVRDIYPDVDLAEYDGEKAGISRRHARLLLSDAQLFIEDLNSTNYSFLNQHKLDPGQRYPLKPGDEIHLGFMTLVYMSG